MQISANFVPGAFGEPAGDCSWEVRWCVRREIKALQPVLRTAWPPRPAACACKTFAPSGNCSGPAPSPNSVTGAFDSFTGRLDSVSSHPPPPIQITMRPESSVTTFFVSSWLQPHMREDQTVSPVRQLQLRSPEDVRGSRGASTIEGCARCGCASWAHVGQRAAQPLNRYALVQRRPSG